MLNDKKNLCVLLDQLRNLEAKTEEITDILIEVKNCLNNSKKNIEEILQKLDGKANKLRKERLDNFSTSLGVKRSAEEINRLTEITSNLDLIQKIIYSNLTEDYLYHGLLSYFRCDYEKSLEDYDSALITDSKNPEIWFNKGIVFAELRQIEDAIQSFEKALEIDPNFYEARYYKWLYSLKSSKYEEVLENLEYLIEDKQNANSWFNAGETLIKINQLGNAVRILDRALELNPNFTKARLLKGISLFDLEEYEKALDVLNYFSETTVNEPETFFWKGKVLLELGQYENSIKALDKFLDTNPEDIKALYLKIDALSKINKCKKDKMENEEIVEVREEELRAQKSEKGSLGINSVLPQVSKKNQEEPNEWYEKGVKLVENNNYEEAIESFDKALTMDSQCPRAWEIKGRIFLKLGNLEKCLEAFNWAMRTDAQYSDRYITKSSISGILEEYEKSTEIFKKKLLKKRPEKFDYSTRTYAINKILQSELFEHTENNTKEEGSLKNKVVKKKHFSEKKLKTSFNKKGKKSLKGTVQAVKVNDSQLESTTQVNSIETKAISKKINTRTKYEKNLNYTEVVEKTLTKLKDSIINLHNFRNDLEDVKNNREVYRTVYEIINKLNSGNDINKKSIFDSQDNTYHLDIEASNKYITSIIEDFKDLIKEIEQYREPFSEGTLSIKLENIYNRRIENFCQKTENELIQNLKTQSNIFEINDIVERMKLDSPFFEFPDDNKEILIGNQAQELKLLLEDLCRLSLVNPLMTAIIGRSGSGKTHFLKNLECDSKWNKSKRLVLIYELKVRASSGIDEIISYIYENKNFRELLSNNDIELNNSPERSSKIYEINNSIDRLTGINGEKFLLFLAVDDIDKYFQEIYSKNESDSTKISEDIRSLLGTFRLILDLINNLCIIFSLNPENYKKMIEATGSDDTLRRRIIVPNGVNGKAVELEKLNEKEAYDLVIEFMEIWIKRNKVEKKYIQGHTVIWPFEQKAISVAWKVTTSIRDFIFILNNALKEKLNETISSFEDLKVNEVDISRVVFKNKLNSCFTDEYRIKKDLWSEIEILVRNDEIKANLQKYTENTLNNLHNEAELADSFEIYFQELGFIRDHRKKGMVIYSEIFGNRTIHIKFIFGSKINLLDAKNLAEDLKNSKSGAGLFICIGETDTGKIKCDLKCEEYFKDSKTNINYVSTVGSRLIDRVDVLHIIKLKEIKEEERAIYTEYLDRKLGFKKYLRSLEFTETSQITL